MILTPGQKRVIEQVINAFETGSAEGNYADISVFHDGPNDRRQITYGRSQTTEYGHLRELVTRYTDAQGAAFGGVLRPYLARIGHVPLVDDHQFKEILEMAGEEDPVMKSVQDKFFEEAYFQPAQRWAELNGFTKALSMLVIYDSFIHSGGILSSIRQRFPEYPPVKGGDEEKWILQYVLARHDWLARHRKTVLHGTVYRTKCLRQQCDKGNWNLYDNINANGMPVKGALT